MEQFSQFLSNDPRVFFLIIWSLFWKGWALWRASKNDQKIWYAVILVVNLAGLIEIAYLLFFQKEDKLWKKIFVKTPKQAKNRK